MYQETVERLQNHPQSCQVQNVASLLTEALTYANTGHDLPYLHRNGDAEELRARGMPLGMMPGLSYEEREVSLGT